MSSGFVLSAMANHQRILNIEMRRFLFLKLSEEIFRKERGKKIAYRKLLKYA